jgi:hypothetical protein
MEQSLIVKLDTDKKQTSNGSDSPRETQRIELILPITVCKKIM